MEKELENRWNKYSSFRCYDVLDLIFDRKRPTHIFSVSQTANNIIFLEFIQQKELKCHNNLEVKMTFEPREAIWKLAFNPNQSFGINRPA